MEKIENGKTYFEDLELNFTAAANLKHPEVTLVSQGDFWAYLHGVKSTMNSWKQILKSTLYIAVVITYTIIQDWSVMAFFLILYFLPKLFLNGYQIYHITSANLLKEKGGGRCYCAVSGCKLRIILQSFCIHCKLTLPTCNKK